MSSNEFISNHELDLGPAVTVLGQKTLDLLKIDDPKELHGLKTWSRGGAETFVTDFWHCPDNAPPIHLIAKACVKLCARETMAEWFERRKVLAENDISFPNVYALNYDGAMWVEEYIPYTFNEAHRTADLDTKSSLEKSLIDTYLRIEGAGFHALSIHDFRSRGSDVVMIDVGSDVGGARNITQCDVSARQRALQHLGKAIKR